MKNKSVLTLLCFMALTQFSLPADGSPAYHFGPYGALPAGHVPSHNSVVGVGKSNNDPTKHAGDYGLMAAEGANPARLRREWDKKYLEERNGKDRGDIPNIKLPKEVALLLRDRVKNRWDLKTARKRNLNGESLKIVYDVFKFLHGLRGEKLTPDRIITGDHQMFLNVMDGWLKIDHTRLKRYDLSKRRSFSIGVDGVNTTQINTNQLKRLQRDERTFFSYLKKYVLKQKSVKENKIDTTSLEYLLEALYDRQQNWKPLPQPRPEFATSWAKLTYKQYGYKLDSRAEGVYNQYYEKRAPQ